MKLGDLLEWDGRLWLAIAEDYSRKLVSLQNAAGTIVGVPKNLERYKARECSILCNPPHDWPRVVRKRTKGRLIQIVRLGRTTLEPLRDWVTLQEGASTFFFNPALGLEPKETLVAEFDQGPNWRIIIPANFVTTSEKVAQQLADAREPRTVYDRLLEDDDILDA